MSLSFTTMLRTSPLPPRRRAVWSAVAREVLGERYDVSVVFIGNARSHRLNAIYRGKDGPTNVLSFPVGKDMGEIYINVPYAVKEAAKYDHAPEVHLAYLFIHGLLHLKGLDHGPLMERTEARLLKRFGKK